MRRAPTFPIGCLLILALVCPSGLAADLPGCMCAVAREADGWCEPHHVGYVASIRIPSSLLFEAVDAHGHELDPSRFQCDTCRRAIDTDGFCPLDSIGFVKRLAYFSRLTYELARGERAPRAGITCRTCRKNSESQGWCDRCRIGRIGPVAIRDREAYERAARAADLLRAANEAATRCQWCGVALLTSTQCPVCRIQYKDGKAVPPARSPGPK